MTDIVCLSSGDEMEIEDIVEVFEEGAIHPKKNMKLESHNLNQLSKSSKASSNETGMRISISQKHSDTLGDSTQVKIVIPTTPAPPNVNFSQGSNKASYSVSKDTTQNNQLKRTARKTMASLTPKKQISKLLKPPKFSVVTLDSDDENECKTDHKSNKQIKLDEPDPAKSKNTALISRNGPCPIDKKSDENSCGLKIVATKSLIDSKDSAVENDSKLDSCVTGQTLEMQIALFETECQKYLSGTECDKVKAKLKKRVLAISDRYKSNSRLQEFLSDRMNKLNTANEELKKRPHKIFSTEPVFIVIKDVLDELTKYGTRSSFAPPTTGGDALPNQIPSQANEDDLNIQPGPSGLQQELRIKEDSEIPQKERKVMTDLQIAKRKRHIRKLENALKACGREIARCEEEDLGLDDLDNENSAYMKVSRYRARYMKIYRKIAQLRELNASLERKQDKKFKTEASRIPEINEQIEKMVNREKSFPDFSDILKLYTNYYKEKNLIVGKESAQAEAKETFVAMGKKLIARRKHDELDVMQSYIPLDNQIEDPADQDPELRKLLEESAKSAESKMNKVLNDFVLKQVEIKEEPEEVPDDEIVNENAEEVLSGEGNSEDESSEESDDNDDTTLKVDTQNT